jgi:hypothetical protein
MTTNKSEIMLGELEPIGEHLPTREAVLDYLAAYIVGEAPAPILFAGQVYLIRNERIAWLTRLRAQAKLRQAAAIEGAAA